MTEQRLGGDFGPVLKAWFKRNDWPQITAERVARAKGSAIGPWASQMSNSMQGKLEPKPAFFIALGWFNNVILTRDFQGITDRRLLDQLIDSEPLTHPNGQPFTGGDFFRLYIGELKPSEELFTEPETVTQDDVDHWAANLQTLFHDVVMDLCKPAPEVWNLIQTKCIQEKGMALEDLLWVKAITLGLTRPTLEEVLRICVKYPDANQFEAVFEEICQSDAAREKAQSLSAFVEGRKALIPNQAKQYPTIR